MATFHPLTSSLYGNRVVVPTGPTIFLDTPGGEVELVEAAFQRTGEIRDRTRVPYAVSNGEAMAAEVTVWLEAHGERNILVSLDGVVAARVDHIDDLGMTLSSLLWN